MMLGGDELGHGQKGNNNTYCQDNELTWLDWDLDERKRQFLEFTKKLLFIRMTQPVFQRRKFFIGRAIRGSDVKDISFFTPSGDEMSDGDWNAGFVKCLGIRLAGDLINDETERGEPIVGETLLMLLNGHWEPIPFTLPPTMHGHLWERLLDTADTTPEPGAFEGGSQYPLQERSLVVLVTRKPEDRGQTVTPTEARAAVSQAKAGAAHGPGPRRSDRHDLIQLEPTMNPTEIALELISQITDTTAARRPLPESTYRLQFHAGFTFRAATAIVPYLRDLGITHCYASPYLKARPGSTHGYDIIDHRSLNPGDRHDRRLRGMGRCPSRATAWVRFSIRCPTTWGSAPTTTRGGTTSWKMAPPPATPLISTSPGGPRCAPSCATRCFSRFWPTFTATCSRPDSSP